MYSGGNTAIAPGGLVSPGAIDISGTGADGLLPAEADVPPEASGKTAPSEPEDGDVSVSEDVSDHPFSIPDDPRSKSVDVPLTALFRSMQSAYQQGPISIVSKMPPKAADPAVEADLPSEVPFPELPEPPTLSRFQRFLQRIGITISVPVVPLTSAQFQSIVAAGNHFGIRWNNKGDWLYNGDLKEELIQRLHPRRVVEHQNGILELKMEGDSDRLLLFPESDGDKESSYGLKLEYDSLIPDSSGRIVIYHEERDARFPVQTKAGITQWVSAMRHLGYDIIYVNSLTDLEHAVRIEKPAIVMVSAVENLLPYTQAAYQITKGIDPSTVMILGGVAAIKAFAYAGYDIVHVGGGGFAPALLREILRLKSQGRLGNVEPLSWERHIAGLETYMNQTPISDWARELIATTRYYPPTIPEEVAMELSLTSVSRTWDDGERSITWNVPLAVDTSGRQRLFFRDLFSAPEIPSLSQRYLNSSERWRRHFGNDLPPPLKNPAAFARASAPEPITPEEIDRLVANPPSAGDGNVDKPYTSAAVHAQWGCYGECAFCSIPDRIDGRRMSIPQVMRIMERAIIDGMKSIYFFDAQFVQAAPWRRELVAEIKRRGIHERIRIHVQTRADMITDQVLAQLREINADISVGLETLNEERAERLGKGLGSGGGRKYVEKARNAMRRLAASAPGRDSDEGAFIIAAGHGDSPLDIARDLKAQLDMVRELGVRFQISKQQLPHYSDRVTSHLTGYRDAQPGFIPLNGPRELLLGEINGVFHPFGVAEIDGKPMASGVFQPIEFDWPESMRAFFEPLKEISGNLTLGDIYLGLKNAFANSREMPDEERAELGEFLGEIGRQYEALKADPVHGRRVIAHAEAAKKKNEFNIAGGARVYY